MICLGLDKVGMCIPQMLFLQDAQTSNKDGVTGDIKRKERTNKMGAGEVVQWEKCLLHKHQDLSLDL